MFDIAARELGMDPLEFRYRNLIRSEDLPTATANGLKLVTLPIEEATDAVAEAIGYEAMRTSKPPWTGVGIANMLEWGGGCRWHVNYDVDMSSVTVAMNADGSVVVATDAADSGTRPRNHFHADRLRSPGCGPRHGHGIAVRYREFTIRVGYVRQPYRGRAWFGAYEGL